MLLPMSERYTFDEPKSVKDCKRRMRILLRGMRDIDRQLGAKNGGNPVWRSRALSSKVYKQAEYDYLKEEMTELRQLTAAAEIDLFEPNDPRHLLLRLRSEVGKELKGETNSLGTVLALVDRYFEHDGSNER
jgi:hypothetical protein